MATDRQPLSSEVGGGEIDDVLEMAAKQRNEAAKRVITYILKSGEGDVLSDIHVMMDYTDAILNALIDRAGRLEEAESKVAFAQERIEELEKAGTHALGTLKGIYHDKFVPDEEKVVKTFLVQSIKKLEHILAPLPLIKERSDG